MLLDWLEEVMLSSALVCLLLVSRIVQKTTQSFFTKFDGKVSHGQQKKPLDFGDNPDHIM